MIIVGNGRVVTRDSRNPYVPDGAVAIDGTKICGIGRTADLRRSVFQKRPLSTRKTASSCPTPLIRTNISTARYGPGTSHRRLCPEGLLDILDGLWWNMDRHLTNDLTYLSAMATYVVTSKNGVTMIFDHHASFENQGQPVCHRSGCSRNGRPLLSVLRSV